MTLYSKHTRTLTFENLRQASIKFSSALRLNLRSALAETFLLPAVSVDLMGYKDARRSLLSRTLLFLNAPAPSSAAPSAHTSEDTAGSGLSWPLAAERLRAGIASATHTALRVVGDVIYAGHRFDNEREAKEGVCDAHKACWSGCKVNKGGVDVGAWSAAELRKCVLPPDALVFEEASEEEVSEVYKGPHRRQTRAPAPATVYGKILLDIRLNYRKTQDALFFQQSPACAAGAQCPSPFEDKVANGTLADALKRNGFCSNGCKVEVVSVDFKPMREDDKKEETKSGPADETRTIIIALCCVFGVLFCLGLVLAYRWRKAVLVRRNTAMYKMEDLSEAAERGKKEALRRAAPSTFKPPEGFDILSVSATTGSRRGTSFKGSSVTGTPFRSSFARTPAFDDTESRVTTDDSKSTHSMGSSRRSKSKLMLADTDRDTLYRHAFPEKFAEVPEETLFETASRTASENENGTAHSSRAGGSVAGGYGMASVRSGRIGSSSVRSQGSSNHSDGFGSRLTPGPLGHGPAPVHGSGQARHLYHHPVTQERQAAESIGDELYGMLEEDDSDGGSMSSARNSVRSALNSMKRNGVRGAANGRSLSDGEDVEHQIAV